MQAEPRPRDAAFGQLATGYPRGTVCNCMLRAAVLTSLLLAVLAPPALAQSGNGLYKPYPAAIGSESAKAYYAQLGLTLTTAALRKGRFSSGMAASAASGPSDRAEATAAGLGIGELVAIGALALVVAGGVTCRRIRQPATPPAGPC